MAWYKLMPVGGGVHSSSVVNDGQWHHIAAIVVDDSIYSGLIWLYIDGVRESGGSTYGGLVVTTQTVPVHFGVWHVDSTNTKINYLCGMMDDIRIYDWNLSGDYHWYMINDDVPILYNEKYSN